MRNLYILVEIHIVLKMCRFWWNNCKFCVEEDFPQKWQTLAQVTVSHVVQRAHALSAPACQNLTSSWCLKSWGVAMHSLKQFLRSIRWHLNRWSKYKHILILAWYIFNTCFTTFLGIQKYSLFSVLLSQCHLLLSLCPNVSPKAMAVMTMTTRRRRMPKMQKVRRLVLMQLSSLVMLVFFASFSVTCKTSTMKMNWIILDVP